MARWLMLAIASLLLLAACSSIAQRDPCPENLRVPCTFLERWRAD